MDVGSLAVVGLEDVGEGTVEDAGSAVDEGCGMLSECATLSAGLDTVKFDAGVFDEGVEDAGGVGAAADAGDDGIREAVELVGALGAGFGADDGLEVADDEGEGVGSGDGADDVVGFSTEPIQSRRASLRASLRVLRPDSTGMTRAPMSFMRKTLRAWRRMSSEPM